MKRRREDHAEALTRAAKARGKRKYVLRLFVAGVTPRSQQAIQTVKEVCNQHLEGRYELEIVDIYQQPEAVRQEQVIVAPTLVKKLPAPLRKLIGDMANREKLLLGLDVKAK